jgi:hypothetical protein
MPSINTYMTRARAGFAVAAASATIISSLLVAALLFLYVPIECDGTWYSYPAFAWSQGGDPSENIPGANRPSPPPERPVASFGWEMRSNLTVLITRFWFDLFTPSWISLKVLGALQVLLVVVLASMSVWLLTADRVAALLAASLVLSDSRVLAAGLSDARPDLFISAFALGLLITVWAALERRNAFALAGAIFLSLLLPTLHLTAANAIAFFLALLGFLQLGNRHRAGAGRRLGLTLLFAGLLVGAFFVKQPILDLVIPTQVALSAETEYRHNVHDELSKTIHNGLQAKASMEWLRWKTYFYWANIAHFFFIVAGVVAAVLLWRRRVGLQAATWAIALTAAFTAAALSMFAVDSHVMVQHAIVLAVLGYIGSTVAIAVSNDVGIWDRSSAGVFIAILLGLTALLKAGHSYDLYHQYVRQQISNPAEQAALRGSIQAAGDVTIVGPAEIWPFLSNRRQPLMLIDDIHALYRNSDQQFRLDVPRADLGAVNYLVVNKRYYSSWHFDKAVVEWRAQGLIMQLSEVGDCNRTVECLQIYKFLPAALQIEAPRVWSARQ